MMRLTSSELRRLGACENDIEKFKELWPKGLDLEAGACEVRWAWISSWMGLVPLDARVEFERKRASAWEHYERVRCAAMEICLRAPMGSRVKASEDYEAIDVAAWISLKRSLLIAIFPQLKNR